MPELDETKRPSHAELARTLVAIASHGVLSTLAREPAGHPYGSLVAYALLDGAPLLLLSGLAEHTTNLKQDPRASLLVSKETTAPLDEGRATLLGTVEPVDASQRSDAKAAFLEAHPSAAQYVDFGDFGFYRLAVSSVRFIGGFGRMSWVDDAAWNAAEADPLAPHARSIVDHMNDDHRDVLVAALVAFRDLESAADATMTEIDRYGFSARVTTPEGSATFRFAFDSDVTTPEAARRALVALAKAARAKIATG